MTSVSSKSSSDAWRRWIITLGWTGFALMGLDYLSSWENLEASSVGLSQAFGVLQASLWWLWPVALILQLRRWKGPNVLCIVLIGFAGLFTPLALLWGLFILKVGASELRWKTNQVLYVNLADPGEQVVRRSRDLGFATLWPQSSVVKLTPVLNLWQHVEPVDTTNFNETGWQRVNQ
ncbi:hypothetical protein [Hymenobacter koreensis]|uniref:Uncharacterized protein n=1 Tax=Hymenobacter koreensis TaxID=1084523 RepID=A0ABP8IW08_9BACT